MGAFICILKLKIILFKKYIFSLSYYAKGGDPSILPHECSRNGNYFSILVFNQ